MHREIHGEKFVDDRGSVFTANTFNLVTAGIQRMYMVENHKAGTVRAWHAHMHEKKWVTVLSGAAVIGIVKIDNFLIPDESASIERYVLDGEHPKIIYIPNGYANGAMNLTDDTRIMYFSDKTVQESIKDDHRYPPRYWDCWEVIER